jgi:hypothetical protein
MINEAIDAKSFLFDVTCPKGNIRCGVKELHGNEILFTLFRAVFLLTLLLWAGI